ncbi:thioredoxin family protein [Micromonospora salmantinae]|uniref:thioredoxin family protein n=1 Tax=Micromonospora salmantinae TaxID=2911211 RepID=UPI003556FD96
MRLLKFYADWCDPCKRVGPLVDAIAAKASVPVEPVDVDESPSVAEVYDVRSVPTFVLLDGDRIVFQGSGAQCIPALSTALKGV